MPDDTKEHGSSPFEVAIEVGDGWKRRLTITVSPGHVARARAAERNRLAKGLRVKGFRKGKVPVSIVEQRYGELLDERVRASLVEEAYRKAVEQEELHPAGAASILNVQYAPGERLTFQAEVEIVPSLELGRVGGFRLGREVAPVTDEEVEGILSGIRAEHSTWDAVDRSPQTGDRVSVGIEPLAAPDSEPTGESQPYQFVLGGGQALPDVEKAIMTLEPGRSGAFLVDFPADASQSAGETAQEEAEAERRRLHIELREVEERRLPELDDELAAKAGKFESVEELQNTVREDLARHHEDEAEGRLRAQILDSIIEANPFTVPMTLVDRYLSEMIRAPEDADPEEVRKARESLAPHAERQIKEQLILDHLIEREGLKADAEQVQAKIEEMASRRNIAAGELRGRLKREGGLEALGQNLAVEHVFEYLKSQSEIE
jgi:trigger factor